MKVITIMSIVLLVIVTVAFGLTLWKLLEKKPNTMVPVTVTISRWQA